MISIPSEFHENDATSLTEHTDFKLESESILNKFKYLSVNVSEKNIHVLEHVCNEYIKEVSECIEKNIHIIKPNTRITKHLIQFLKYARICELIFSNKLCENSECKPEHFGAKNNLAELLGHIEANLSKLGNQYKKLIEDGKISKN